MKRFFAKTNFQNSSASTWRKGKLIYRLCLMLLVSICLPVVLFSYISYSMSYRSMEKQYRENKNNLNRQIAEKVENNFYALKNQANAFFDYESIAYILTTEQSEITDEYIKKYNQVYWNLVSIIQGNFDLDGISLINMDGEVKFYYDRDMSRQNLNTVEKEKWYEDTVNAAGRAVILPPHSNNYADKDEKVVSVCRAISDPYDDKMVGVMKIDQDLSTFMRIFDSVDKNEGELNLVFDSAGNIFYISDDISEKEEKELCQYSNSSNEIDGKWVHDKQDYIVTKGQSLNSGWQLISLVPEKTMEEQAKFIRIINTWTAIILAVICVLIALVISLIINRPIRELKDSMVQFQEGNLDIQMEVKRNDEFGMMADVFNSMVKNIRKLINEKYELNLLKKQAQLENYQSQINPHFLFNTLNSIKAVSMQGDQEKTTKMIQYFSENFRYALNRGVYTVSFREELEYINKYVTLQMMRFGDRFQIEKEIEEDVLDNDCLRMVLQPIVENAFYHGLEKTVEKGRILIVAQNVGEEFFVYVSNTGTIVPEEKMREINAALNADEEQYRIANSDKVGIYNFNARIKYHYGNEYGLKMIYGMDKETTIRINLPCIRRRNQDESFDCR